MCAHARAASCRAGGKFDLLILRLRATPSFPLMTSAAIRFWKKSRAGGELAQDWPDEWGCPSARFTAGFRKRENYSKRRRQKKNDRVDEA